MNSFDIFQHYTIRAIDVIIKYYLFYTDNEFVPAMSKEIITKTGKPETSMSSTQTSTERDTVEISAISTQATTKSEKLQTSTQPPETTIQSEKDETSTLSTQITTKSEKAETSIPTTQPMSKNQNDGTSTQSTQTTNVGEKAKTSAPSTQTTDRSGTTQPFRFAQTSQAHSNSSVNDREFLFLDIYMNLGLLFI